MPEEVIRSRQNPLVARLRAQRRRTGRDLALIEGPRLLAEALAARVAILEVAATPRFLAGERGVRLLEALEAVRAPVRIVHEDVMAALSELETSQGVLALARRPAFAQQDLYRGVPLVLVAVGIQNPGNLGALLRTAEAAGVSGAYLCDGCADPGSWKALRGSMGSAFRLPHVWPSSAEAALAAVEARGLATLAASANGNADYDRVDFGAPCALLLGGEAAGLAPELLARASARVRIPMAGAVESLNVGVAAGVLLLEAARQRRAGAAPR